MSKESTSSSGIGVTGLLLVAFIILKIVGVEPIAHWSWWWVVSPVWIPLAIAAAFILVGLLIKAVTR